MNPRLIALQKLARVEHQYAELTSKLAELSAERSKLYSAIAGEQVDLRQGRKVRTRAPTVLDLSDVTDEDRANARAAMRSAAAKRRRRAV